MEYYNNFDLHTIYVIADYEKMVEYSNAFYHYNDIQLFYVGTTPGENCFKNVIFGDIISSSYASLTAQYIMEHNFDRIFIVGSTLYYGQVSRKILIEELSSRGYPKKNIGYYDMLKPLDSEASNVTKQIKGMSIGENNNTVVIIVATKKYVDVVFPALYDNGMTFENNFTIISYLEDEAMIDENRHNDKKQMYINTKFIAHSGDCMNSTLLDSFKVNMKQLTARNNPLFSDLGIIHDLFKLLVQVYINIKIL